MNPIPARCQQHGFLYYPALGQVCPECRRAREKRDAERAKAAK